ncbi:MAG: hypothetical protein R2749_19430 [Acidimicrobiales bacterium]
MEAVRSADIVVNATSVGMGRPASDGVLPCPAGLLHGDQVVADLVYQPLEDGTCGRRPSGGAR